MSWQCASKFMDAAARAEMSSGVPRNQAEVPVAAESKQSMLRTASSIQSRSSIMLTASSTGATRPAQGAIAAFYLPSKKQDPRRKQGESSSPGSLPWQALDTALSPCGVMGVKLYVADTGIA